MLRLRDRPGQESATQHQTCDDAGLRELPADPDWREAMGQNAY